MVKRLLLERDLLQANHIPVMTFFNAINESKFVNSVEQMSLGIGSGINATTCLFPDDLEEEDIPIDGVMFALHNEDVVVDFQTFFYYLEKACKVYLEEHPEDFDLISRYLREIVQKYKI